MFQLSTLLHTHPKFGDVFCDVFLVFLDFGLCRIGLHGNRTQLSSQGSTRLPGSNEYFPVQPNEAYNNLI